MHFLHVGALLAKLILVWAKSKRFLAVNWACKFNKFSASETDFSKFLSDELIVFDQREWVCRAPLVPLFKIY